MSSHSYNPLRYRQHPSQINIDSLIEKHRALFLQRPYLIDKLKLGLARFEHRRRQVAHEWPNSGVKCIQVWIGLFFCREYCDRYVKYRDAKTEKPRPTKDGGKVKWPTALEEAFWEAIVLTTALGRTKKRLHPDGKANGRHELTMKYLKIVEPELYAEAERQVNPKHGPRKVVSSHVQTLKGHFTCKVMDADTGVERLIIPDEYKLAHDWLGGSQRNAGKRGGKSRLDRAHPIAEPSRPPRLQLISASMTLKTRSAKTHLHTFASTGQGDSKGPVLDLRKDYDSSSLPRALWEINELYCKGRLSGEVVLVESTIALPDSLPASRDRLSLEIENSYKTPQQHRSPTRTVLTSIQFFEGGEPSEAGQYTNMSCEMDPSSGIYGLPLGSGWWVDKLLKLLERNAKAIAQLNNDSEHSCDQDIDLMLSDRRLHAQKALSSYAVVQEVYNMPSEQQISHESCGDPFLVLVWRFSLAKDGEPGQINWRKVELPPLDPLDKATTGEVTMDLSWDTNREVGKIECNGLTQQIAEIPPALASDAFLGVTEEDAQAASHMFPQRTDIFMDHAPDILGTLDQEACAGGQVFGQFEYPQNQPYYNEQGWTLPVDPAIAGVNEFSTAHQGFGSQVGHPSHTGILQTQATSSSYPEQCMAGPSEVGLAGLQSESYLVQQSQEIRSSDHRLQPFESRTTAPTRSQELRIRTLDPYDSDFGAYEMHVGPVVPSCHDAQFECSQDHEVGAAEATGQADPVIDDFTATQPYTHLHQSIDQLYSRPTMSGADSHIQAVQQASTVYQRYINESDHNPTAMPSQHRYPTRHKIRTPALVVSTLPSQPDMSPPQESLDSPVGYHSCNDNASQEYEEQAQDQPYISSQPHAQLDNNGPPMQSYSLAPNTQPNPSRSHSSGFIDTLAARRGSFAPTISTTQDSCFDDLTPGPTTGATESFDFAQPPPTSYESRRDHIGTFSGSRRVSPLKSPMYPSQEETDAPEDPMVDEWDNMDNQQSNEVYYQEESQQRQSTEQDESTLPHATSGQAQVYNEWDPPPSQALGGLVQSQEEDAYNMYNPAYEHATAVDYPAMEGGFVFDPSVLESLETQNHQDTATNVGTEHALHAAFDEFGNCDTSMSIAREGVDEEPESANGTTLGHAHHADVQEQEEWVMVRASQEPRVKEEEDDL